MPTYADSDAMRPYQKSSAWKYQQYGVVMCAFVNVEEVTYEKGR